MRADGTDARVRARVRFSYAPAGSFVCRCRAWLWHGAGAVRCCVPPFMAGALARDIYRKLKRYYRAKSRKTP